MLKTECIGCGHIYDAEREQNGACPHCGTTACAVDIDEGVLARLSTAAAYRRVGRFEDSQQELENLLELYPKLSVAYFGSFLNAYEVTEYRLNGNEVSSCNCLSTSRRPVQNNVDWQKAMSGTDGNFKQWAALSNVIELRRQDNIRIKDRIPKYRAILACDNNGGDKLIKAAYAIFDILCGKTDIFFAQKTLQNINNIEEKGRYLAQALKNPEIAPVMFVLYSGTFNYRSDAPHYYTNIVRQCRDFARMHAKTELFSVYCDCEPSPIMKTISIKSIKCKTFDPESYERIADRIMDNILTMTYDFDEAEEFEEGRIIALNEGMGTSPIITGIY